MLKKTEQEKTCTDLNSHRREMEKRINNSLCAALSNRHLEEKLYDVVLVVDDVKFDAHKNILSSCSSYFCTLFTGAWANPEKRMYTIPGVSSETMHVIINYAYNHSVSLTEDNVMQILAAADQFLVSGIIQACCVFLEHQLCLENCIGIWKLLDFYYCPELREKAFFYILHHFEEIIGTSEELLDLSEQQLAAVLESDHLNVKCENIAFEVILWWIDHMPDQRQGSISLLLPKVRLTLMTYIYFRNSVMTNAMIKNNAECMSIINEVVEVFQACGLNRCPQYIYSSLMSQPRLPSSILLVTGGKNRFTALCNYEAYDYRADSWVTVACHINRAHHGAVTLDGFVYLIGGCNDETNLNTVQRFDLSSSRWQIVTPMYNARCDVSVVALNGCIYAMGGFNGEMCLSSVECYKPETNQWTIMARMNEQRSGASATVLHGKVYICGGFYQFHSLHTAECYNPDTNLWTTIAPMTCCRRGLGVIAYKNRIYAVGGTVNEYTLLRCVEAYNPLTNRWHYQPSMRHARSYFGIEVVDDQLFVVGGYGGYDAMCSVERYDGEAGWWYTTSNIAESRSGLSCCVLHGFYSLAENLFPRGPVMLPNVDEEAGVTF